MQGRLYIQQIVLGLQSIKLTDTTLIGSETTAVDTLTAVAGIMSRMAILTPHFSKNAVVGR